MFEILSKYGIYFWKGIGYTLLLSLISLVMGSLLGLLLTTMRLSKNKILKIISGIYISIFRGTPLFVQLSIVYIGLPLMIGLKLNAFTSGVVAVSLNSAAYVSEIIRSGIQSIDRGQIEAGRSLGLSEKQTMKNIILPQAVRNILPALGNEFITLVKETSIVSTIGVHDLMRSAEIVNSITYKSMPLIIVAILYLIITTSLSKILSIIEKKVAYND